MAHERGPVDLVSIGFPTADVPDGVAAALRRVPADVATILDVVTVRRGPNGALAVAEDDPGVSVVGDGLEFAGLAAEEDALALAADLPAGSSAVVVAFEHTWARDLVVAVGAAGGVVLATARIPGPMVDELVELALSGEG